MAKNEKYSSQIYRVDGKNVFFEVLNSMFHAPYNKVNFNFISYDGNTKKQIKNLSVYMGLDKTLLLCNEILSGKLSAMVSKARTENSFNGAPLNDYTSFFTEMGGTAEAAVQRKFDYYKSKHPWLQPGMAISRQFKIQAGQKVPWIFRVEYGPGRSNETGLIAPTGKPEEFVNVPLTNESLKMFALVMQCNIQAYYNQFYAKLSSTLYKDEEIRLFNRNGQENQVGNMDTQGYYPENQNLPTNNMPPQNSSYNNQNFGYQGSYDPNFDPNFNPNNY